MAVRPLYWTRGERAAAASLNRPSAVSTPARKSSAMASMMPLPQIPVAAGASSPGAIQSGWPMIFQRGSNVAGSMRTRSIAPGAARWPCVICAPSKAGPVGLEQHNTPPLSPRTISALVPTSTISMSSSLACGASASCTATLSAPTWPAMQGSTCTRAAGFRRRPSSRALRSTDSLTASANGAPPSSTGLIPSSRWCMTVLPTSTTSTTSSSVIPAALTARSVSCCSVVMTARCIFCVPSGCIIT